MTVAACGSMFPWVSAMICRHLIDFLSARSSTGRKFWPENNHQRLYCKLSSGRSLCHSLCLRKRIVETFSASIDVWSWVIWSVYGARSGSRRCIEWVIANHINDIKHLVPIPSHFSSQQYTSLSSCSLSPKKLLKRNHEKSQQYTVWKRIV